MRRTKDTERRPGALTVCAIAVGLSLVLASHFPFGSLVRDRLWTGEDAARYNRITLEYHKSAYQTPARKGLTEPQMEARQQRLRKEFESMRDRLTTARRQPRAWRQMLLWTGATLIMIGIAGRLAGR